MTKEYSSYLAHHGIFGMKWGVRRYQNEDGTLTAEGRARQADKWKKVKEANTNDSLAVMVGIAKFRKELSEQNIADLEAAGARYRRNADFSATMERYFREEKTNISLKDAQKYSDQVGKVMFSKYKTPILKDKDTPELFREAVRQLWEEDK